MSRISAIHHINIEITDIERSKEWYGNVFGLERKNIGSKYADMMLEMYTRNRRVPPDEGRESDLSTHQPRRRRDLGLGRDDCPLG